MPDTSLKRATWLELFYDLAFVALVAQLTYLVADYHTTVTDWLNILIIGYAIFIAWWMTTAGRNLQDSETPRDKLLIQVQMVGAFLMSITMPAVFEGEYLGFFGTLAVMRLLQVSMILRMYRLAPEHRPKTLNIVQGVTVGAILWLASALAPDPYHFILALMALSLDILTPQTTGKGNTRRMLNVSHLQERLGLFLMLVLGESMLVVALANTAVEVDLAQPIIVFSGLFIVICVWWVYFRHLERCGEGVRPRNLFLYLQAHGWLFGSIILLAASFKNMLKHGVPTTGDLFLYGLGMIGIVVTIMVIRYTLHGWVRSFVVTALIFLALNAAIFWYVGVVLEQTLLLLVLSVISAIIVTVDDMFNVWRFSKQQHEDVSGAVG
ncbi:MAG: low temperature requirement protein A [Patescibacteria group bacterium]